MYMLKPGKQTRFVFAEYTCIQTCLTIVYFPLPFVLF